MAKRSGGRNRTRSLRDECPADRAGIETRLLAAVTEDFRPELERWLQSAVLGRHKRVLVEAVEHGDPDLGRLFRYGMERLPADDDRPDDALTAYFVILSEFQRCPDEGRILATKCMEYCESEVLDCWSDPLSDIEAEYEAISQRIS